MLLGANLIFAGPSEEKLLDGVCFYLTDVPAGTTILGACGKVFSEGVEWSIDFGDGTGTQVFSTTANIPAHTYDSAGDYVIQIIGSGITTIKSASRRYYPVIATTAAADCPYVTRITVGGDFSFFPFMPYTVISGNVQGRWHWFTNLKEIKLAESVVKCDNNGCLAYMFRSGDVEFVAPGLQLIRGIAAIRNSVFRDPCALLPREQTDLSESSYIFAGATSLEDVSGLPRGLTGSIPSYAFYDCSKLSDTSAMPDGVTGINSYTFGKCISLVVADLRHVKSLGTSAFVGCSALTDIYVKGVGHTKSTTSASNFLTSVIAPNVTLHYVGDVPAYDCKYTTYLKHLDISKAQSVGFDAFQNCTALESILFGNATKTDPAFSGCNAITSVRHAATGDTCWFGGGVLKSNTSPFTIYIPDNVRTLLNQPPDDLTDWYGSFQSCTGITSLDLNNVEEIGVSGAKHVGIFYECTSLAEINAPKLKQISSAGTGCFEGCTSLTTLNMPLLEWVGSSVFKGCSQLTELPPNCKKFGAEAFYGTSITLDTLIIPADGFCEWSAFAYCSINHVVDKRTYIKTTNYGSYGAYALIKGLTDISFPDLEEVRGQVFAYIFRVSSQTVKRISLPKLKRVTGVHTFYAMSHTQDTSTTQTEDAALESFELPALESIGYNSLGSAVDGTTRTFEAMLPCCPKVEELHFNSLQKIYNNISGSSVRQNYGTFANISTYPINHGFLKRIYLPKLSSILGNCSQYLFYTDSNTTLEEIHFGVANQSYITSHAGWPALFGLPTDWPGRIYFDLNPDGSVATNLDGSAIAPVYDGSI